MTLQEMKANYERAAKSGNTERAVYLARQIRDMQLTEQPKTLKDIVPKEDIQKARKDPRLLAAKLERQKQKAGENRPDAGDYANAAKRTERMDDQPISSPATDRSGIVNTIIANFYRTINTGNGDNRQLLLLIAALSVLNTSTNSAQAISAARRLAQLAMSEEVEASRSTPCYVI
jgi:hypothetical protein